MRRLAALGIWVYAASVLANDAMIRWRRRRGHETRGSAARIARFEHALAAEARRQHVHGVICGHIHTPAMHDRLGVQYVNTGDWVESCTAVVEHQDGRFELLRWPAEASTDAVQIFEAGALDPHALGADALLRPDMRPAATRPS
jgi:UDP-2,3-diacylglucosamine pyrophosphatase LpxH